MASRKSPSIYNRIRQILESARTSAARSVNTTQVVANWLIGREIVQEEQRGKRRAGYGEQLLQDLSSRLAGEFGKGFSVDNLEMFRRFFLEYSSLLVNTKSDALRRILPSLPISHARRSESASETTGGIHHALRVKSDALRRKSSVIGPTEIGYALRSESWKPGKLTHQDLGQLQLYVNYYDRERRTEGDNPSLGLILCADKNDAVVKYTLGPDQQKKIFASRYKLHLPTEAELKAEIRRELEVLRRGEEKV